MSLRMPWRPKTDEQPADNGVDQEFDELLERFLVPEAKFDQAPLRTRLGRFGQRMAIVLPDPGDLEPVWYPDTTMDEKTELAENTLLAVRSVFADKESWRAD